MGPGLQPRNTSRPSSPKEKLERLLTISAIVVGYLYVWTFQENLGIQVAFISVSNLLRVPIIAIVVYPLVRYAYVQQDWLQFGRPKLKSVRFFQAQFPSLYIRDRCGKCAETAQTCRNFIAADSTDHNSYWLDHIFPLIKKDQPEQASRTFQRGYICKLVFGLEFVLLVFMIISVVTLASKPVLDLIARRPVSVPITPKQAVFVLACAFIAGLIRALHSPDAKSPTGCWKAWQEINDAHKLWMRNNESILLDVVCHAGGNAKAFAQRAPLS